MSGLPGASRVQCAAGPYATVFGVVREAAQSTHTGLLSLAERVICVRTAGYPGRAPVLVFIARPAGGYRPVGPQDLGYAHLCFRADCSQSLKPHLRRPPKAIS